MKLEIYLLFCSKLFTGQDSGISQKKRRKKREKITRIWMKNICKDWNKWWKKSDSFIWLVLSGCFIWLVLFGCFTWLDLSGCFTWLVLSGCFICLDLSGCFFWLIFYGCVFLITSLRKMFVEIILSILTKQIFLI